MRVDLLHPGKDSKSILHTWISNQYLCDKLLIFLLRGQVYWFQFQEHLSFSSPACLVNFHERMTHMRTHIWLYIHMCIPGLQLGQSMFVSFVLCSTWISGSGRGTAGSGSCGHVKPKTGGNMFTWILQTLRHDFLHIYLLLICDLLYQSGAGWHDHVHRIVHGSGFNQSLSPAWGTQDVPFDIRHF